MPKTFDLHRYTANWDPTAGGMFVSVQDVMAATAQMWAEVLTTMVEMIPSASEMVQIVTQAMPDLINNILPTDGSTSPLITGFENALSGTNATAAGNQIPQWLQLFTTLGPQLGQALMAQGMALGGFSTGSPILGQLISAGGGSGNTLTDWTNLLGGFGGLDPTGIFGGIPGFVPLTSLGLGSPNLLQNLFDANAIKGAAGPWSVVTNVVYGSAPGSMYAVPTGQQVNLMSDPLMMVAPNQVVQPKTMLKWAGISGSGNAFQIGFNTYNAARQLIAFVPTETITNPSTASTTWPNADANGWYPLRGMGYTVPGDGSVVFVRQVISILPGAGTGGQTWWSAPSLTKQGADGGLIDPNLVGGVAGISGMGSTLQQTWDQLTSALQQLDANGVALSDLGQAANAVATKAHTAMDNAVNAINILNYVQNQPMSHGLAPTSEATFPLLAAGTAITSNMSSVPAGSSLMATAFRPKQNVTKGFIELLAFGNGGTGIFVNLFKVDPATNNKNLIWSSSDLGTLIPNGTTPGYVRAQIPSGSQPAMKQGETYVIGIANAGSGTLSVHAKALGTPNHPTETIKNFGGTRTLSGTGGTSPASLTDSQITYGGTVPYFNLGVLNVPANYNPPDKSTCNTAGVHTYNIPTWAQVAGTLIDLAGVGGGGSGMSEWNAGVMAGGTHGTWAGQTFVYGSDPHGTGLTVIPTGTTQITVSVGAGGPQCTGYWQNGNDGTDTVFYVGPNTSGTVLLTCPHGQGGSNSVGLSNGTGTGPGNYTYPAANTPGSMLLTGGVDVGINQPGSAPGGGGGGATWYELGGVGAEGFAAFQSRMP